MAIMQDLNEVHKTTFIFATHDPRVMHHASRIINLRDGTIVDDQDQAVNKDFVPKYLS